MAATRIIPMHIQKGKTLAKSLSARLDYSQNPEKTDGGELITSYKCTPESADEEFLLSKKEYERITGRMNKGDIIAYQIRQSFKPGEITPEEAKATFDDLGVKKLPKIRELNAEYAQVLAEKRTLYADYRRRRKQMQDFVVARKNVEMVLDIEPDKEQTTTLQR